MSATAENPYRIHRFSVYNRSGEVGLLTEDDRVELIDGQVIDMAPIGSRHARAVNYLNMHLVEAVRRTAVVAVQNPVARTSIPKSSRTWRCCGCAPTFMASATLALATFC